MLGRWRRVGILGGVLLATGCAAVLGLDETTLREDGPGAMADAAPDAAPADSPDGGAGLVASPATLVVRRGGSASLRVELTQAPATPASVTVSLAYLPSGVSAMPAILAAGETSTSLVVTAAVDAPIGAAKVRVVALDGPPLAAAEVTLLVAGPAGAPDPTFDADGVVVDATKGTASTFRAVVEQADGKILAGGLAGGPGGWLLRRFTASGAPDGAFDAATAGLPVDGELRALAVDAEGRILCVGTSRVPIGGLPQLTIVRVLPSGAVDASFGGGAVRVPTVEAPAGSSGLAAAVEADGSVYAAGVKTEPAGETGIVVRFGPNGVRDTGFDGGKLRAFPKTRLVGVAADDGGAITLGGTDTASALTTFFLARLGRDGGVEPGFGAAGVSTFANSYRAVAFARLADGALVLAGDQQGGGAVPYTAGLATPSGAAVFARGFATANGAAFHAVAPVGSAGFVAAGHAAGPNGEARVARVLVDGGRDESFSDGGAVVLDPGGVANGSDLRLFAAAVQADGRILVAGSRSGAGAVVYRLFP